VPSNGHLAQLAFEQSLRAFDKQDEALRELRSRTGILLAASTIACGTLILEVLLWSLELAVD
jgi:hypothetical protein